MKKLISIFLPLLLIAVLFAACTHNKVYGTVVVSSEKYKQIKADKLAINKTLKGLQKFNSENPKSEEDVLKALNTMIKQGDRNLSHKDEVQFKKLLGDQPVGIKGIVKEAYDHQRGFDDDLSDHIRTNMLSSIKIMTHSLTKNKTEQHKIYKKILKDTDMNKKIYEIGGNE